MAALTERTRKAVQPQAHPRTAAQQHEKKNPTAQASKIFPRRVFFNVVQPVRPAARSLGEQAQRDQQESAEKLKKLQNSKKNSKMILKVQLGS